jgi:hypothetical protein
MFRCSRGPPLQPSLLSVVTDRFQQTRVGGDGMETERHFRRALAGVDPCPAQESFKLHVVTPGPGAIPAPPMPPRLPTAPRGRQLQQPHLLLGHAGRQRNHRHLARAHRTQFGTDQPSYISIQCLGAGQRAGLVCAISQPSCLIAAPPIAEIVCLQEFQVVIYTQSTVR